MLFFKMITFIHKVVHAGSFTRLMACIITLKLCMYHRKITGLACNNMKGLFAVQCSCIGDCQQVVVSTTVGIISITEDTFSQQNYRTLHVVT